VERLPSSSGRRIKRRILEGDHKPSSVVPTPLFSVNREDGHLSRTLIAQDLKRPNPFRLCPSQRTNLNGLFTSPLWNKRHRHLTGEKRNLFGLAPGGVYLATLIAQGTVSSYLTFSPLPTKTEALEGGMFLWHFPYPCEIGAAFSQGQSALRTTLPCGARTFLPS